MDGRLFSVVAEGPVGVGGDGDGRFWLGGCHAAEEEAAGGRGVLSRGDDLAALQVREGLQGGADELDIDRLVRRISFRTPAG